MNDQGPDFAEGADPRLRHVEALQQALPATVAGAPAHKKGARITFSDGAIDSQGRYVSFAAASLPAIALHFAMDTAEKATTIREQLTFTPVVTPTGPGYSVDSLQEPLLFDYFEAYFAVAIFSFLAVEVYCNEVMDRFAHQQLEVKIAPCGKKKTATLEVRKLERRPTRVKYGDFLPTLLQLPSPKVDSVVWSKFLALEKLRNDVVHAKADDLLRRVVQPEIDLKRPTLFFRALQGDVLQQPKVATELICYFAGRWLKPTWLQPILDRTGVVDRWS